MNIDNLVKMVNQIEAYYRSEPDRTAAITAIETHLRRFWAPPMRKAIVAHLEQGGAGLGELARAAVGHLKAPPAAAQVRA